jgi:hypothetical protein
MERNNVINIVNSFVRWPRFFTIDETLELIFPIYPNTEKIVLSLLDKDSRFIKIKNQNINLFEYYYISKRVIFKWFLNFNLRLSEIGLFCTSDSHFAFALSSLRPGFNFNQSPKKIIEYGIEFGLIANSYEKDKYSFPIAKIFSFLPSMLIKMLTDYIVNEIFLRSCDLNFDLYSEKLIEDYFNTFPQRTVEIVRAREGLDSAKRKTLEKIGDEYGLTKERIRQIEQKFWMRVKSELNNKYFFTDTPVWKLTLEFLCKLIYRKGNLIISGDDPDVILIKFLSKCSGIPIAGVPFLDIDILCFSNDVINELKDLMKITEMISKENLFNFLEAVNCEYISSEGIDLLVNLLNKKQYSSFNKAEKVTLVLKAIGKPAHYTEVTKEYNLMFPGTIISDYCIHAILGREQCGVVWIGVKGTYALKEWGYEHPKIKLHDLVTSIVRDKYYQTGKPVPFSVVVAEAGKFRHFISHSSLILATNCNNSIKCVSKDLFIPKEDPNYKSKKTDNNIGDVLKKFKYS